MARLSPIQHQVLAQIAAGQAAAPFPRRTVKGLLNQCLVMHPRCTSEPNVGPGTARYDEDRLVLTGFGRVALADAAR